MKNVILGMMLLFVIFSATAQDKKSKNAKHTIEVNGSCDDCKDRIESASFSVKGVKSAVWDIDTHQLSLIVDENKTSVEEIKKTIATAGYDSDDVKATKEDYSKLPTCCQYERK